MTPSTVRHHLTAAGVALASLAGSVAAAQSTTATGTHKHYEPTPAAATARADGALAPRLAQLGTHVFPVTTRRPGAQHFVNQGIRLAWAFNHAEAGRAFREAARLDPTLAMAYWGQALVLGPNINAAMEVADEATALGLVRQAQAHTARASARERALVDALARRYTGRAEDRAANDRAYADAMRTVHRRFPRDLDIAVLYVEAMMDLRAWNYWTPDGRPHAGTAGIVAIVEDVLRRDPKHPGALHLLIHLVEATPTPERAERAADTLLTLMPAAGHMVHMASHVYVRVGRYADAIRSNQLAIAADEDYLTQCRAQGLYPMAYYPHNVHFLWYAATLDVQSALAGDAARRVASRISDETLERMPMSAGFRVVPYWHAVRFGRWDEILRAPKPPATSAFLTGAWHYARGTALVATGQVDDARAELAALEALLPHPSLDQTLFSPNTGRAILAIGPAVLAGEIAAARGDLGAAIAHLDRAVRLEDALVYTEPAEWAYPTRHALGAVLLDAGRAAEAETVYWDDLRRTRDNGWALTGLVQALRAQGKHADADLVDARRRAALARSDVTLPGSRFGSRPPAAPRLTARHVALPGGVTLEYVEHGPRTGRPVILLHGVTDSWRSFEGLLPYLPSDVRAFAISQRGHGGSSRPDDYRYEAFAADVAAFMDALALPRAAIVGHSMGSLVALRFALDHPRRAAALVLLGAFPTVKGHPDVQAFWDGALATLVDPVPPSLAREFQVSTIARPIAPAQLDAFVADSLRVPARVWKAAFREFLAADFSADLGRIEVPALILAGGRDAFSRRHERDVLATRLPRAHVVDYPEIGHALHWEDPARIGADVSRFLESLDGADAGRARPD
jgi:pimeloyl-ACP methyl ester carboxylesterase/tetratricopeptide (TPR) repeat protein